MEKVLPVQWYRLYKGLSFLLGGSGINQGEGPILLEEN
jgi:hypothetical protein